MTKFIRNLLVVLLIWGVLTMVVYALGKNEDIRLLRGFWPFLALLLTCVSMVFCCVTFFVHRPRRDSAIALILVIVVLVWTVQGAGRWGVRLHFQLYRQQYEALVQRVLASQNEAERKAICANDCGVRSTPSLQVGFPYNHFFLSSSEIIYDPAGEISRSGRPPYDFLIRAEQLSGPWYIGYYGD